MNSRELVDQLAEHRTLGTAPRAELEWLVAHGSLQQMNAGEVVSYEDGPVGNLYVVLSGCLAIYLDSSGGRQKFMEWRGGDVTGLLPYSRLVKPPGQSVVLEPSTLLAVPANHHREMTRECPEVTTRLVHSMLDRARAFTSSGLQDEKMISLGKLSAGLAHELNNPAAAIERAAALLQNRLEEAERAVATPGACWLPDSELAAAESLRISCLAARVTGVRSPIEQAEREEAIADWLADHRLDAAIAEPLADTAVTLEQLDAFAKVTQGPALNAALRWVAAGCSMRRLVGDIQEAAMRISGLVLAIKGFTHMDQAKVAEHVDLMLSLDNTVAVLRSKARARSVAVAVALEPGLPPALGFAGELNQIWANLIDNALDAVSEGGRVEVRAGREPEGVVVRIIDNGRGIPPEIRDKIFDPFFTTKPMGLGTGLGLDIVRRLVRHNGGQITVESQPGRTEFRVTLPVAEAGDRTEAP